MSLSLPVQRSFFREVIYSSIKGLWEGGREGRGGDRKRERGEDRQTEREEGGRKGEIEREESTFFYIYIYIYTYV